VSWPAGQERALRGPTADAAPGDGSGRLGGAAGIASQGTIGPAEAAAVLRLVDAVTAADGVGPMSEQTLLHIRHGGDRGARNLLAWRDGELTGFAHLDSGGLAGELAVHPAYRRQGLGRALAGKLAAVAGRPLRLWAHGDLPAAAALAARAGFTRARGLWQMYRPLASRPPEPRLPAGVMVRSFVPGQDEQAWLTVNARAFADHPEQGRWTRQDLAQREQEPWFDPAGFFLAFRGRRLAGFHWTKIHAAGPPAGAGPVTGDPSPARAMGEVYVIGVDPSAQGTGLGRALTLVGLHYLRDRGMPGVMLYVEESNTSAIALYESLGFSRAATDVVYELGT
jgi:mycothiol synthase